VTIGQPFVTGDAVNRIVKSLLAVVCAAGFALASALPASAVDSSTASVQGVIGCCRATQ